MNRVPFKIYTLFIATLFLIVSCSENLQVDPSTPVSYIVSDSLKTWCKNRMQANRITEEENALQLMFFEEELNILWRPAYSEAAVQDLASKGGFTWEELPSHEGNRRWRLSLNLQQEDSTYIIPNNLLLYLFR